MIMITLQLMMDRDVKNRRTGPGSASGASRSYLASKRGSMSGGTGDDGSIGSALDDSANDDSPD